MSDKPSVQFTCLAGNLVTLLLVICICYSFINTSRPPAPLTLPTNSDGEIKVRARDAEKPLRKGEDAERNEYHRLKAAFDNRGIEPNWWQAYVAVLALGVAVGQAVLFWIQLRKMDIS